MRSSWPITLTSGLSSAIVFFALSTFGWASLDAEPRREARLVFSFPRKPSDDRLSRAQAVLLGHVIGDSLGALVERKPAAEIARLYPEGVRELADGGVYKTLAGQPTGPKNMASCWRMRSNKSSGILLPCLA